MTLANMRANVPVFEDADKSPLSACSTPALILAVHRQQAGAAGRQLTPRPDKAAEGHSRRSGGLLLLGLHGSSNWIPKGSRVKIWLRALSGSSAVGFRVGKFQPLPPSERPERVGARGRLSTTAQEELRMKIDVAQISWLWLIGAWYDIFGAVLLARSSLAVASNQLLTQSSSGWGGFSAPLLRMFCEQKIDARFATFLLVFGFLLQALAALGVNSRGAAVTVILFVPLPVSLLFYFLRRSHLTARHIRAALKTRFPSDEVERLTTAALSIK
jgi:hypothetical protein